MTTRWGPEVNGVRTILPCPIQMGIPKATFSDFQLTHTRRLFVSHESWRSRNEPKMEKSIKTEVVDGGVEIKRTQSGTEAVVGIYFDTLEIKEPFSIDEKSFEGMRNLQFLIVRGSPRGRLRLPQDLPLGSLKQLIMNWSTYLRELPDLSKAINLEKVYLDGCKSLVTFPSSIQNLLKLRDLHLENCTELESFPTLVNLKSLEYLNLRGCSRLRNFPQIYMDSSHGISIEVKDCFWNNNLPGPDYLGGLMRCMPCKYRPEHLVRLTVKGNMLEKLWEGVQSLGSLVRMNLSGSVNLNEFPDLSKATNLERLELNYCHNLVTVPCTIENLKKLVKLEMKGCIRLEALPTDVNLSSLETLDLSWCSSLTSFPQISWSVKKLYLNDTAIEQVPCCIEKFWRLLELTMCRCKRLKNISPNIFSLSRLVKADFSDCEGVETALSDATPVATMSTEDQIPSIPLHTNAYRREYFEFNNCFKLDRNARALILRSYVAPTVLPGEEVPAYFTEQASGTTVAVKLPQSFLSQEHLAIKACVVVGKGSHSYLGLRWHFRGEEHWDTIFENLPGSFKRDHLVLLSFKFRPSLRLGLSDLSPTNFHFDDVEFESSTINPSSGTFSPSVQRITGCGIRFLNRSTTRRRLSKLDYYYNDVVSEFFFNRTLREDAEYFSGR
ncbi:hypothetical protein EUTSA_v10024617mg [Eutrema salsugineum]|uniref:Uncharacterized protein n=1 Tax=Eutrema salsugineum TaxID=72664 RepID=V4MRD0_EUTSA|nr:hypothetical protein EUTSA_v10024617mg [Eutrema salsugineum]